MSLIELSVDFMDAVDWVELDWVELMLPPPRTRRGLAPKDLPEFDRSVVLRPWRPLPRALPPLLSPLWSKGDSPSQSESESESEPELEELDSSSASILAALTAEAFGVVTVLGGEDLSAPLAEATMLLINEFNIHSADLMQTAVALTVIQPITRTDLCLVGSDDAALTNGLKTWESPDQ
jgi:hypothetical protein